MKLPPKPAMPPRHRKDSPPRREPSPVITQHYKEMTITDLDMDLALQPKLFIETQDEEILHLRRELVRHKIFKKTLKF